MSKARGRLDLAADVAMKPETRKIGKIQWGNMFGKKNMGEFRRNMSKAKGFLDLVH